MGKLNRVRVAVVAVSLLVATTGTGALAAEEWVAADIDMDGGQLFVQRDGGLDHDQTLAARVIATAERAPTLVQIGDDSNGVLIFEAPRSLALAPIRPLAPQPAYSFDNGEGVTYFGS
jgi:hypothetical protein